MRFALYLLAAVVGILTGVAIVVFVFGLESDTEPQGPIPTPTPYTVGELTNRNDFFSDDLLYWRDADRGVECWIFTRGARQGGISCLRIEDEEE